MAATMTKQEITEKIKKCNEAITRQQERKAKLEEKLAEIKKTEILDAIVNSGKTLEEVLELINK